MDETRKKELLNGVADMHVHTGPSISIRELDIAEMAEDAMKYGLKGFVAKDHYFCSTDGCDQVNKHICGGKQIAFGLMAMNNSMGGFNIKAVSTACEMGTKVISLPTVSAKEHQEFNLRPNVVPFKAAGKSPIKETPIAFLDENGNLDPKLDEILRFIGRYHPSVVLATGHGSAKEIDVVIKKAFEYGIRKVYVNHPVFIVDADIPTMKKWADQGAFIELNCCNCYKSITRPATVGPEYVRKIYDTVGAKQLVISTDFGQKGNIHPVDAMADFMAWFIDELKVPEEDVFQMAKANPCYLLDL